MKTSTSSWRRPGPRDGKAHTSSLSNTRPEVPASAGTTGFSAVLLPFLLVTLIWSTTWIVIKDQIGGPAAVPAAWSVSYRFAFGALGMFAVAALTGAQLAIGGRGHALALAIGVPQFVLNFQLVYAAERYVTSGVVAVVFALLLVPNALWARLFFAQRVGRTFLIGSAIAIGGVALLFANEAQGAGADRGEVLRGIGFTLLAVLAASVGNCMTLVDGAKRVPPASLLAWAMTYGALGNAVIAWPTAGSPVVESRAGYWFGLLYLGLAASALAFFLYYRIIRAIGPAKAAYSSVLVPIIAMLISTIAEDYRWSPLSAAGGVLTMVGLVVALVSRRPAAPAPMPD